MVAGALSNRQRLVVRYFRHPTGGTAWTLVQDKQSWTRSPQMRFRQHWIPHLDKTAAVSPPHSERDVGAVLKPTLWTNSGAAPAYFVVLVDLKPCPPYHIDPKLAISEHNVHHTPLNPSKHYPEYAFTQIHDSVLGNKGVTEKEERLVTSVYDENNKEDWLYGTPTSIQEGSTCQRWRKK